MLMMVIIILTLPLQYIIIQIAYSQIDNSSSPNNITNNTLSPPSIVKPKVDLKIEGTIIDDKFKGGDGNDELNGKEGDDQQMVEKEMMN